MYEVLNYSCNNYGHMLGNCDLCKLQLHHGTVSAIKNLIENVLLDFSFLISLFDVLVFNCWQVLCCF